MYKFAVPIIAALCVVILGVDAAPHIDNAANKEEAVDKSKELVGTNKTVAVTAEKSLNSMATGKSVRPPFVAVPVYPQPFVGSPWRYPRVGMPIVVPKFGSPTFGHRLGGYSSGYQQPPQMYSTGYVQPTSAYASPIGYQHQPLIPASTYNYAPYASNSYSSYGGYRSAAEDANKLQQPPSMDLPLQSTVQYETRYVVKPQTDYLADQPQYANEYNGNNNVVEYVASGPSTSEMQPREVLLMSPAQPNEVGLRRYDAALMGLNDMIGSTSYIAPMSETTGTEQVFWEVKKPYGSYITRPDTEHTLSPQLEEPYGRYLQLMRRWE